MSEEAVKAVIEAYVAACQAADVKRLQAVFHPGANMMGYMQGRFLTGGPKPFFDSVTSSTPCTYDYKISEISVAGDVGSARLDEEGYMGSNFTDYFQLARTEDGWQIVSKVFHVRQ